MDNEATVTLQEVTEKTVESILKLEVADDQKKFVASNAVSIAHAHFSKYAWFRAICADDTPVGFVMLYIDPKKPEYWLWRFMIDKNHQGKGYGRKTLDLVTAYIKTLPNAKEFLLSYTPAEGNPSPFYQQFGFEETGKIEEGERVMKLDLV